MSIRIFVTGGTFDKEYNELTGELFFKETHLPEMLKRSRSDLDVTVRTLMMIDSLHMTNEDRDLIVHQCRNASENKIIITHGTDTMDITAKPALKTTGASGVHNTKNGLHHIPHCPCGFKILQLQLTLRDFF